MNINDYVCVTFWMSLSGMMVCGVNFFSTETQHRVIVHLTDADHQSLIDTLEKVWPNWTDLDQNIARGES